MCRTRERIGFFFFFFSVLRKWQVEFISQYHGDHDNWNYKSPRAIIYYIVRIDYAIIGIISITCLPIVRVKKIYHLNKLYKR